MHLGAFVLARYREYYTPNPQHTLLLCSINMRIGLAYDMQTHPTPLQTMIQLCVLLKLQTIDDSK
jgi:hypothetical protein